MSNLSQRLAQPEEAGVFELPADKADALRAAADTAGLRCYSISLLGAGDPESVLQRFATVLDFPDWFSEDWDSLNECLTDLSWDTAPGYVLLVQHCEDFQGESGDDFDTLIQVLSGASASWSGLGVPFWGFVLR